MRVRRPIQVQTLGIAVVEDLLKGLGTGLLIHRQSQERQYSAALVQFIAFGDDNQLLLSVNPGYSTAWQTDTVFFVQVQFLRKGANYAVLMEGMCSIKTVDTTKPANLQPDATSYRKARVSKQALLMEVALDRALYCELRPNSLSISQYIRLQLSANTFLHRLVDKVLTKTSAFSGELTVKYKWLTSAGLHDY